MLGDQHIPFQARLKPLALAPQSLPHRAFCLVTQVVEACVEIRDEPLFITEFLG
ncbi:hypothetical protein [Streptomyces sp. NPDC012888]|uniref:hypothetical protein n=1 Tax=Streptomyces sp. NPDC012888 TaxID=3364855 RepID=UPI003692588A